jgi:hypothetical protein
MLFTVTIQYLTFVENKEKCMDFLIMEKNKEYFQN